MNGVNRSWKTKIILISTLLIKILVSARVENLHVIGHPGDVNGDKPAWAVDVKGDKPSWAPELAYLPEILQ